MVGLCSLQDERPRLVKHYQYFSWPDHGVPNEPGGVLSFLDQVNRAQRSIPDTGPIIVHCRYEPVARGWVIMGADGGRLGYKYRHGKIKPSSGALLVIAQGRADLIWS